MRREDEESVRDQQTVIWVSPHEFASPSRTSRKEGKNAIPTRLPLNAMAKQGCRLRLSIRNAVPNLSLTVRTQSQTLNSPDFF